MKKFSDKVVKVIGEAKDLVEKILRWREMQLDRFLHVKYEPNKSSSQSHFEAIMADVNEGQQKVEEVLKIQSLLDVGIGDINLEGIDNSYLSDEEKARIEYNKKLKQQKEIQAHTTLTKKH